MTCRFFFWNALYNRRLRWGGGKEIRTSAQKPPPKSPPYWNMRWPPEPPVAHPEVQKWTGRAQRILNWNISFANCACIDWEGETELVCSWRLASSSEKLCCSTARYESILREHWTKITKTDWVRNHPDRISRRTGNKKSSLQKKTLAKISCLEKQYTRCASSQR